MIQLLNVDKLMDVSKPSLTEKFNIPGLWNKGFEWIEQKSTSHKQYRDWRGLARTCSSPTQPATARDSGESNKVGVQFPAN